jgi:lysyl-tRNA synthetase class 2
MNWQPSASLQVIRERARIYRQIRSFFNNRGCLEVETPVLASTTNTDVQIATIEVPGFEIPFYLQTSPEFAMKRLLAAGRLHHPEFSLLEWYRTGYDYHQLMDEIELLITTLSLRQCSFTRITYKDLFRQVMDFGVEEVRLEELRGHCEKSVPGTNVAELDFDQCLDLLLGVVVAPAMQGYQFVYDYPLSQAALARLREDDDSVAERFELFFDGIELANGFSELTDADEQRARFEQDNAARAQKGLPQYAIDERLLAALESGMDDCAGVALGLDRLLMVLLELDSIDQALTFTD